MINEKIYTQEDLNNAITKAILEMTEVLKRKDYDLDVYKKALMFACVDLIMEIGYPARMATELPEYMNDYLQKAREENAT